jgi:hypothetical protein
MDFGRSLGGAHGDNLAGCLSRGKTAGGIAADKDFYAQDVIRRVPEWFRVRYSNSQLTLTKYLESCPSEALRRGWKIRMLPLME